MSTKVVNYKTIGMQKDNSESAFDSKFAFENMNMRITARDSNTLLSLSNERGNSEMTIVNSSDVVTPILGYPIGSIVLNENLILFTTMNLTDGLLTDRIYKITKSVTVGKLVSTILYEGILHFDVLHPIEVIPFYENENVQKVYWTDAKNQMRFMNIQYVGTYENTSFDFVPPMELNENVSITKNNFGGTFPAGVIQYAFSYINNYGIETNLFYTSPLYYLSNSDTGEAADGSVTNSFDIILTSLDGSFDKVRIYSIIRTSVNSTPIIKKVIDLPVNEVVTYSESVTGNYTGFEGMVINFPDITNFVITDYDTQAVLTPAQAFGVDYFINGKGLVLTHDSVTPITINLEVGGEGNNQINIGDCQILLYPTANLGATSILVGNDVTITSQNIWNISIQEWQTDQYVEVMSPSSISEVNLEFTDRTSVTHYGLIEYEQVEVAIDYATLSTRVNAVTDRVRIYGPYTFKKGLSHPVNVNLYAENIVEFCPFGMEYSTITGGFRVAADIGGEFEAQVNPAIEIWYTDPHSVYSAYLTDTNYLGETQTSTSLLYTGSEKIVAGTIAQKDNTLFLGNLELLRDTVGNTTIGDTEIREILSVVNPSKLTFSPKTMPSSTSEPILNDTSQYPYEVSRTLSNNDFNAKTFKYGEYYRFGVQFQHETGKWSEALWILDAQNTNLPSSVKEGSSSFNIAIKGTKAEYLLNDATVISTLVGLGYRKVRGIVVYPSVNERRVIAQGILNPTVYQIKDRSNNSPSVISSWFLRPMLPAATADNFGDSHMASLKGGYLEFRPNKAISGVRFRTGDNSFIPTASRGGEIENFRHSNVVYSGVATPLDPYINHTDPTRNSLTHLKTYYDESFIVEGGTLTFNSPDIEFDEGVQLTNLEETAINIIGLTHLTGFESDISVSPTDPYHANSLGFFNPGIRKFNMSNTSGVNVLGATPLWYDQSVGNSPAYANFVVFPWQAKRAFNNVASTTALAPVMTSKHSSNLRFSALNTYFAPVTIPSGISTPKIFNSTEEVILNIGTPDKSGLEDFNYQANVNKLVLPNRYSSTDSGLTYRLFGVQSSIENYDSDTQTGGMFFVDSHNATENVIMKYKSAPHAVFNINWDNATTPRVLPSLNNVNKVLGGTSLFYKDTSVTPVQQNINVSPQAVNLGGGVWLADLVRPINVNTMFGGKTSAAFENNIWEVGGLPISLVDINNSPLLTVTVPYTSGDTYIQRYDCIRTYPYSVSDEQTMTEIVSFLCETRINLDTRTDKNRGKTDNRFVTPLNSNLINPIYNQKDNYFTYRGLDYDLFSLDKFPNSFTWSGKKLSGELTDAWAHINLANIQDVDGIYGNITALKTFNNGLIGFQDKATFEIQYNSRVQVNASDGVPIEIANSGSVDGIRYISSSAGAKNKHSIVTTPFGLYFIDSVNRSINIFNGQISSLSDKLGFHSWANQHLQGLKDWSPYTYDNFTTHFDNINKDIYFINKSEALCYSELLGQFTSFFSYENVPYMFNNWDSFFSIKRDTPSSTVKIWEQNKGEYNKFFGAQREFYTTLMVNPYPQYDKVFNTFEFRADSWGTTDNWVTPNSPTTLKRVVDFTKLKVWDEYQVGEQNLTFNNGFGSSLKQKFRSWRTFVPRVVSKEYSALEGGVVRTPTYSGLDRLRNNWAYMQLYSSGLNNYQTILHDVNIYYSM